MRTWRSPTSCSRGWCPRGGGHRLRLVAQLARPRHRPKRGLQRDEGVRDLLRVRALAGVARHRRRRAARYPGPTRTGFQEEAGTKVASWAMDPGRSPRVSLPQLGRSLVHVAGEVNQVLAGSLQRVALEPRVEIASWMLDEALIKGTLSTCMDPCDSSVHAGAGRGVRDPEPGECRSALPEQLAAVAAVDPLTRITLERFGDPLVAWFQPRQSTPRRARRRRHRRVLRRPRRRRAIHRRSRRRA